MTTNAITVIETAKIEAINREHRLCANAYGDALEHARECGRMLHAVKADLTHGEWLPWLERNFDGSERTARVYMQLSNVQIEDRQSPADMPASISAALREIAKPRPRPSPRDAIATVSGMEDDDEPALPPSLPGDLDRAQARLKAPEATWSEQHERRANRIFEQLNDARAKLEEASTPGLSAHAIAELLRDGEIRAREASAQLGNLAFAFER